MLGQHAHTPNGNTWEAGLHLVRYLKGARDLGLLFGRTSGSLGEYAAEPGEIVVYCDADWGGDLTNRRSRAGFALFRGHDLIGYASKKEPSVALSTGKAELMAACFGAGESISIMNKVAELEIDEWSGPSRVFSGNTATIQLSTNPSFSWLAKHIHM